jgi:methionyl-tRNA formyltransferase
MGSGPVAADSLERLARNFTIEAVITKPKPDHHRGDFPVIETTKKLGLHTLYASNKSELDDLIAENEFDSNVGVIIDFGIIVSKKVIDSFPLGIVNSHFSLLPQWRGADPIAFAILSGQPKTGVSLMVIDEGMDTGKLITYRTISINPSETTPSLTQRLIELSDQLLQEFLPRYSEGSIKTKNQPHPDRATYSRKLTKEDGIIDWNKPAVQIEREIRAFIDWPKSRTELFGKEVIITKAHTVSVDGKPGEVEVIKESGSIIVYCGSGYLCIERLKPAGKKEMSSSDFVRGYVEQ